MSRILNRPMFRGGGKVSSYGNGIATGLADGGMPSKRGLVDGPGGYAGEQFGGFTNKVPQAAYDSGRATTGGSIMNRLRNVPYLGRMLPAVGGTAGAIGSQLVLPATIGAGIGGLADFYAKSTSTPEGYRRLKEMGGANFNFDETNPDVGEVFEYIDEGNTIGEKVGFFPRGGYDKKLEELGYNDDGTKIKFEKDNNLSDELSATELALKKRNEELTAQLNAFLTPQTKKDTKKESIAKIKEKQELLEEVMGGGKSARIADASDMALSFASKALGEGATVKSAFADFLGDESKRPSRSQKVKDAAANAAIQSYLTEQMSEKDFNTKMQVIMGQQNIISAAKKKELKNMSMAEIGATSRETGSKKKQETAQRYLDIRSDDIGTKFVNNTNSKKIPVETLFVKENIGEYFLDDSTDEFFEIVILENGEIGKERRG